MLLIALQSPVTDASLRTLPRAELREAMLGACRRLLSLPRRTHTTA